MTEAQLLLDYPSLRAQDLVNAWSYAKSHRGRDLGGDSRERGRLNLGPFLRRRKLPIPGHRGPAPVGPRRPDSPRCRGAGQGIADDVVLADATAADRILLTQDRRDFIRLHNAGMPHVGIVVCTYVPDAERLAGRIDAAIAGADAQGRWLCRRPECGPSSDHRP